MHLFSHKDLYCNLPDIDLSSWITLYSCGYTNATGALASVVLQKPSAAMLLPRVRGVLVV